MKVAAVVAAHIPRTFVDLNRSLYLADPWFERDILAMDSQRLRELNRRFEMALTLFFASA